MRFPEALYYTLNIRRDNPNYLLCGSVALILAGKLPVRDVHDIDFVTNERFVNVSELLSLCDDYGPKENEGYTCYNIHNFDGVHGVWDYNLFVFPDSVKLGVDTLSIKVNMQNMDDIINWKTKYNRPKDKKDLKQMTNLTK